MKTPGKHNTNWCLLSKERDGGWVKIECIYVLEGKVNEHICMHYLNGINNQKGQNEGIKLLNWM